jgi:hypothetical protein
VGNGKPVAVSGIAVTGTDAGNYTANTTASATADITEATLTVSAAGVNKVYDGTTNATVTLSDDRVVGDDLTTSYTSASFADKNVGTGKPVAVSGIAVTGTDAGNYVFNASAQTTADISPATIAVTANDTNRPYGTPNPDFTAGYSGFVNGEDAGIINGSPVLSTTATTNSPVGTYPIEVGQGTLGSANYIFDLNSGMLTVTEVPPALWIEYVIVPGGETNHAIISGAGVTPASLWQVLATTNFVEWVDIGAAQAASDGTITFSDTNAPLYPARFYRLTGN